MNKPRQIVYTLTARCRDCYRCLRVCPVKAIRMEGGQARVDPERCISCGACIRECPQGAKTFRNDVDAAEALIAGGGQVAASLAPSFAAAYKGWRRKRLVAALRRLGFCYVAETSVGAYYVSQACVDCARASGDMAMVCSACPAVVNYIEKYRPELVENITPVASPMTAHARHIRRSLGDGAKIIFIGPCVAKKSEAERPELAGTTADIALTFRELDEWLRRRGLDLASCEESEFDELPQGDARIYPLPGGLLKTASLGGDISDSGLLTVHTPQQVKEALHGLGGSAPLLLEPLFCPEGCVGGPGMPGGNGLFERRAEIVLYNKQKRASPAKTAAPAPDLSASFAPRGGFRRDNFSEDEIRRVLEMTGKADKDQQLNCGACGYDSCREKAVAVLLGMAVPEMCMPYMRRLAERRTDKVIETSPNGIIVLNENLEFISMNPAFKKMFSCSDEVLGRKISYLIDSDQFEKVGAGTAETLESSVRYDNYGFSGRQIIYALREERQIVGVFIASAAGTDTRQRMEELKSNTLKQAQELLEHQISMAQEMAKFLGENTAHGEEIVRKLMSLNEAGDDKGGQDI